MQEGNSEKKGVAVRERKPQGLWAWPEGLERYYARTMGDFGAWPFGRWRRHAPIIQEWLPDIDIFERDGRIVVKMDLPGLKPEDVDVTLEGDVLQISGKREMEKEVKDESYYCSERAYGEFSRAVRLPEGVDAGSIDASFKDGVLEVTVPKPAPAGSETRKIPVK